MNRLCTHSMFPCCYADIAGWFWHFSNVGDSWVCIPQGFHICCHPKMCWGELLKTNYKTLQTAPLLPSILQESLRVGIGVANPGSSCWVSHLSAGFVPLGEGGGRGWPSLFRKSWCDTAVVEALLVTPDVHQPPGWSLQGVVPLQWGPAAVFAHFDGASVGFVQPGSRTRSFPTCPGQVSCRGTTALQRG